MCDDAVFVCSCNSPRDLTTALSAIAWKAPESQMCDVSVSEDGILFQTEDPGCLQASLLLKRKFLLLYERRFPGTYVFRLDLTALVKCLCMFMDTATDVVIRVIPDSEVRLAISDPESTTECAIRMPYVSAREETQYQRLVSDDESIGSLMVSSCACREFFRFPNERKNKAVHLEVILDSTSRTFEVRAEGVYGTVCSAVPLNQPDFHHVRVSSAAGFAATFLVSTLTPVLAAMTRSYETQMKFQRSGALVVQQDVKTTGLVFGTDAVIEFLVYPLELMHTF